MPRQHRVRHEILRVLSRQKQGVRLPTHLLVRGSIGACRLETGTQFCFDDVQLPSNPVLRK